MLGQTFGQLGETSDFFREREFWRIPQKCFPEYVKTLWQFVKFHAAQKLQAYSIGCKNCISAQKIGN
jgi:hypothetical protein